MRAADYTTKHPCGIYEIKNDKGRISYKIFAEIEDLEIYLAKNKDKVCEKRAPVFSMECYEEYSNTTVRKITEAEAKSYIAQRTIDKK